MQPLPASPPPGYPYRPPMPGEPTPLSPAARTAQEYALAPAGAARRAQADFLPKVLWEQARENAAQYSRKMGRFCMLSMLAHIFVIAFVAILAGKFATSP